MIHHFDHQQWEKIIQRPCWYSDIFRLYQTLIQKTKTDDKKTSDAVKEELYQFFQDYLEKGSIALGTTGPDWDRERKPIDTVVIHHTKNSPGITWQRLNAMHLMRLYMPFYAANGQKNSGSQENVKGQPVYSHHFRNGKPVFMRTTGWCG